jgi:SAM-dependent methyltransferase
MTTELVAQILKWALVALVVVMMTGQCRKPRWWFGRRMARVMNIQHSGVTDWGLGHVALEKRSTILDVGCGGGRTIAKLASVASKGKVYGIDYSAASVAVARATNADAIAEGRVDVQQGSVSKLPFADDTFDVVSAVETHYYWPNLTDDLREIQRVLKPGGTLLIIAETYKGRRHDILYRPAMMLLRATYLTPDEHRDALTSAGYADVEVSEERSKGWICALGRKPSEVRTPRSA